MITLEIKQFIIEKLKKLNLNVTPIIEIPKRGDAHLAMPLFNYAKEFKKPILEIFNLFKNEISSCEYIYEVKFLNGFLNIYLNKEFVGKTILNNILTQKENFANITLDKEEVVVLDYSSPNIAKSFSVGHLRSTVIGNSLKNIYEKAGYKTVSINYLGDWGTQFGKMIVAYQKWGDINLINQNPIEELQKLYVLFHDKAKEDPTLEDEARLAFLKLEQNDKEYLDLWQYFKDESIKEFMNMYKLLDVSFDSYNGESFYNDKMDDVIGELEEKGLSYIDDGATIVDMGEDMPPALIKKNDGATLYITRDLAALNYRMKQYNFSKALYVVGNEQKLHFEQLIKLSNLLGNNWDVSHVNFGLVLLDGQKMSTRKGNYKRLDDVLDEAIKVAYNSILEKNPNLENKEEVSKAIGVGAIIFNDLKNDRHLSVDFNLENMLKFEGQTGPYVQYSSVRISSLLNDKEEFNITSYDILNNDDYFNILFLLDQFEDIITRSINFNSPSYIARYVLNVAQSFNSFYAKHKINVDDNNLHELNLAFVYAIRVIINESLRLLGIKSLKEM